MKRWGIGVAVGLAALGGWWAWDGQRDVQRFEGGPDMRSLKSVRAFVAHLKDEARRKGLSEEAAGVDYYEAYEFFLDERVNPGADSIDMDAYERAIEHRNAMPAADLSGAGGPKTMSGKWSFIGPKNMDVPYRTYYGVRPIAGRINALAYDPNNANTLYAGAGNGGVFRSTDGGTTWSTLNTDTWDYLTVSSLAIDPANSNVIYVGTGDHHGGVPYGMGIMKSTNGGSTWTNYGKAQFGNNAVSEIVIDPANSQHVTITVGRGAAGSGAIWNSTDGGATWNPTNAPAGDWRGLSISTSNGGTRTYYAVGASGLYKSTSGATWSAVTTPFVSGYDVACSRRTSGDGPLTLYVLDCSNKKVWRTVDGGANWDDMSVGFPNGSSNYNWSQSTYDFWIGCSTNGTDDNVFVGLITVVASPNRGATWTDIGQTYTGTALIHNDQHSFANHPTDPNQCLVGADGGAWKCTYNPGTGTASFTGIAGQMGVAMFYAMAAHPTDPTRVLGGTQDNASPNANGDLANWNCRWAGDGGFCAINQNNPQEQYSTSQSLSIYRTANEWANFSEITPTKTGENSAFIAPIALANNQTDLYALTNRFRKRVAGTWNGAGTGAVISAASTGRCIATSPNDATRLYTGAPSGEVWMCTNAPTASSWTQINSGTTSLPNRTVKDISVSPSNASDILVAVVGTGTGHLWRCRDTQAGTRNWEDASGTGLTALPDTPANTIERDPYDPENTWYVGNDLGVFMTTNAGNTWMNMTAPLGLPNVRVNDLVANPTQGYLYAATYGRGMWRIKIASLGVLNLAMPYANCVGGFAFTSYVYLTGYAPTGGAVVTLSSSNTNALTVPATVNIGEGKSVVTFTATSKPVATTQAVTVTASYNGTQKTDSLNVVPPSVITLRVTPNYCTGGDTLSGLVQLNGAAPAGGRVVTLVSNNAAATVPASVTVIQGAKTASFSVNTTSVASVQTVTITATTPGKNVATVVTVYPLLLSGLSLNPTSVSGGNPSAGTVTLTRPAPTGGANVLLSSNKAQAAVPASTTVAAGQTQKTFNVTTTAVVSTTVATITATRGPVTKTATLTINP